MAAELFPSFDAHRSGWFSVGAPHELYWEQSGDPHGIPVLFLHGGPGRPWPTAVRRFFDPRVYRIVAFDQRGTWRSKPLGCLEDNTTEHLVDDIEALRGHLRIEDWLVFGGSWGSFLSLVYAIRHPERVRGMVLWGIYLGLATENTWVNRDARWMRPEACDALAEHVGERDPDALLRAYRARVANPDSAVHLPALEVYEAHQDALSNIRNFDARYFRVPPTVQERRAEVRIGLEYFLNGCFVEDGYILDNAARLSGIPGAIVHGADDLLCPPSNALDLARAWPDARLTIVPNAGHFAFEPGIREAILAAFHEFGRGGFEEGARRSAAP